MGVRVKATEADREGLQQRKGPLHIHIEAVFAHLKQHGTYTDNQYSTICAVGRLTEVEMHRWHTVDVAE